MALNKNTEAMLQISTFTFDKMWDLFFTSLSNFSWTQEQAEKMMQAYLEQKKINRQEAAGLMEEMLKQAKNNQQKIREVVDESIKKAFSEHPFSDYFESSDISKKLNELEQKIEDLKESKV